MEASGLFYFLSISGVVHTYLRYPGTYKVLMTSSADTKVVLTIVVPRFLFSPNFAEQFEFDWGNLNFDQLGARN